MSAALPRAAAPVVETRTKAVPGTAAPLRGDQREIQQPENHAGRKKAAGAARIAVKNAAAWATRKNSETQPIWGGEEQKLNLQALREAGIYGVAARALCQQAHITPRYVDMHALKARQESCNSGLLVCRLRDKDPCPETWRVGSPSHRYDEDGFRLTWLDEEDE
jgi:hypothetical protein